MSDAAIVSAYRRAMARAGVVVKVTRVDGMPPNAATFSVSVAAIVRNYTADTTVEAETGLSASRQGAISQGDRMIILMADDLAQMNFPLPLAKNDLITLPAGDVLNVTSVDALKRAAAGAIELKAVGIA